MRLNLSEHDGFYRNLGDMVDFVINECSLDLTDMQRAALILELYVETMAALSIAAKGEPNKKSMFNIDWNRFLGTMGHE